MLFNSYVFLAFLAGTLILLRVIPGWPLRKALLVGLSYLFYMAWNPPFVILLWISTVADWFIAKKLHETNEVWKRKCLLMGTLAVNLGLLSYFKYGQFFLDNTLLFSDSLGISFTPIDLGIVLPVGISFYTFQTLSYTIDIYQRKARPWHSFLDYALFVTFFPQLVAGPIVRATDFLPQCSEEKKSSWREINWGMSLFILGLFLKVAIADTFLSAVADKVYDSPLNPNFYEAWVGTFAFAIQIFCDFSGYSLAAIGVALMLGFSLPDNFRSPYGAIGFTDFWRRWHISLSTWMRDYVYIPMGGNRRKGLRTNANLMVTMLVSGLWHGASWLFVIWGALHGFYLFGERFIRRYSFSKNPFWKSPIAQFSLSLLTFLLVCLAWVFFRAKAFGQAKAISLAMLGWNSFDPEGIIKLDSFAYRSVLVITGVALLLQYALRNFSWEEIFNKIPWMIRPILLAAMFYVTLIALAGEDRAFIYFQF